MAGGLIAAAPPASSRPTSLRSPAMTTGSTQWSAARCSIPSRSRPAAPPTIHRPRRGPGCVLLLTRRRQGCGARRPHQRGHRGRTARRGVQDLWVVDEIKPARLHAKAPKDFFGIPGMEVRDEADGFVSVSGWPLSAHLSEGTVRLMKRMGLAAGVAAAASAIALAGPAQPTTGTTRSTRHACLRHHGLQDYKLWIAKISCERITRRGTMTLTSRPVSSSTTCHGRKVRRSSSWAPRSTRTARPGRLHPAGRRSRATST